MLPEDSLPTNGERQLHKAWEALNRAFPGSPVSLTVRHRLTACVTDVLTFCGLVRALNEDAVRDFESWPRSRLRDEFHDRLRKARPSSAEELERIQKEFDREHADQLQAEAREQMAFFREHGDEHQVRSTRYASSFKALFIFIRALQDACYAVILEARGEKAGKYSSMSDALKRAPFQTTMDAELPEYRAWCVEFRSIRDRMKLGIQTGSQYATPGPREVALSLYKVVERPPQTDIDGTVGLSTLDRALKESTRLLEFIITRITPDSTPKLLQP